MSNQMKRHRESLLQSAREVQSHHPNRRSVSGALLAEILGGSDWNKRCRAANTYACLGYRRGFRALVHLAAELEPECAVEEVTEARRLLGNVLIAFGCMQTPEAHALLVRVLQTSRIPWVRADVLEAMAWERPFFELSLVLPFVSFDAHNCEIISALYALDFYGYANKHPRKCRQLVAPFLAHPYSMVRIFAIETLSFHGSRNLDLIAPLVKDPDLQVQQEARNAIR